MWQERAKITKAQKDEIGELLTKLSWTKEFYEKEMDLKIDDMFWLQAVSCIGGLEFLINNPKQWKKD